MKLGFIFKNLPPHPNLHDSYRNLEQVFHRAYVVTEADTRSSIKEGLPAIPWKNYACHPLSISPLGA